MKIAVLFDGAGLARLGLEHAGHDCTGVELNPVAHYLSQFVGSGNCVLGDATEFDLTGFDAVWSSPPCQTRSSARTQGPALGDFATDYLAWSLSLSPPQALWVENVSVQEHHGNFWGTRWNAAQFEESPRQNRVRIIGGNYPQPLMYRHFKRFYNHLDICPCITASEYKGCASDKRRASRWYKRRLTIEECAWHQYFDVPDEWHEPLPGFTAGGWREELYRAIGNGVPVLMAKRFGEAAK